MDSQNILKSLIPGYHQYEFENIPHICFVSESLFKLTGFEPCELLSENEDKYLNIVHPSDREKYLEFLNKLSKKEQTLSLEYRIVKKDKSILFVKDTFTSVYSDGKLIGSSVLSDITELKNEIGNLSFLNDTIPCGFVKYTCDKTPKITFINDRMKSILGFTKDRFSESQLEICMDNIFLIIPMEERRRFSLFLKKVYREESPVAGEITALKADGSRVYLFGWVTKVVNDEGNEEFQSVCMDITENHLVRKVRENDRYLKALSDVYDMIFEFDFRNNTVKCIYGEKSNTFRNFQNIPMKMEEATDSWVNSAVFEDDRNAVKNFFAGYYVKKQNTEPEKIKYRARSSDGIIRNYSGIFLRMDSGTSLFCCRKTPEDEISILNMQEIMMHFSDGIAAFEVINDTVTPLYASQNVYEFFGFTKEEWLPLMKKSTLIKDFVAKSSVKYESFLKLLKNGEAEFTYYDNKTAKNRRIKAICSEKSQSGNEPRYIMLYNVDEPDNTSEIKNEEKAKVYIRTFGYFDVFVDGKPIAFRNKKSEELFALLVDRRGGFVTSDEAISCLWEDETVNSVTLARYRKVALRLKNILEEYGIADVMEAVDGKRRIVTDKVKCDLFDYLSGAKEYSSLFKGSYLSDYSWGEVTLGELESSRF